MAAAIGNQYALGCVNSGRPLRYKTADEMQIAIDGYFVKSQGEVLKDTDGSVVFDKYGQPVMINQFPPTITGLALHLGFTSRLGLLNYEGKEEFVNTISIAKARVEAYTEARLFDRDGVNGAKFSLTNNFKGWKDTQTIENIPAELANKPIIALADSDLKQLLEIMERNQIQGEIVDIEKEDN